MTDAPTPPLGTPGPRPGDDRTQVFSTYPPAGPPPPPPGAHGPAPGATEGRRGIVVAAVVVVLLTLVVTAGVVIALVRQDDDEVTERSTTTTEAGGAETTATDATTTTEPGSTTAPDTTSTTEPAVSDAVDRVVGSWTGTYTCTQGLTVLDLEISAGDSPDEVTATFSFSAHPTNPGVPTGSFTMDGTATEAGVVLTPGEWVDRPGRYTAVGLTAPLPVGDRMQGRVEDAPGCTDFSVSRA